MSKCAAVGAGAGIEIAVYVTNGSSASPRRFGMLDGAEVRLAVDIGGTFTDIVLDVGRDRRTRKVLTTPTRPEQAVLDGMRLILADAGAHISDVDVFIHGTTLATNAIIERRGAKTALIATEGFRDVLDIGTESRYDQYDLSIDKPKPLVPRSLRFTIPERLDAHGGVRLPLDEAAVRALAPKLRAQNVESIAFAFLHAYANPAHERRAASILQTEMRDVWVTLSSAVCPEIREYERTSTAVANAYVQPLIDGYLGRMAKALQVQQFRGAIYLVTSGGGVTSIETARRFPGRLLESGPAGGAFFAGQIPPRRALFERVGPAGAHPRHRNGRDRRRRRLDRAGRCLEAGHRGTGERIVRTRTGVLRSWRCPSHRYGCGCRAWQDRSRCLRRRHDQAQCRVVEAGAVA